jgi:hypothetical protein
MTRRGSNLDIGEVIVGDQTAVPAGLRVDPVGERADGRTDAGHGQRDAAAAQLDVAAGLDDGLDHRRAAGGASTRSSGCISERDLGAFATRLISCGVPRAGS